jgi:hypothetical protein
VKGSCDELTFAAGFVVPAPAAPDVGGVGFGFGFTFGGVNGAYCACAAELVTTARACFAGFFTACEAAEDA